jgi:hypothetical protein
MSVSMCNTIHTCIMNESGFRIISRKPSGDFSDCQVIDFTPGPGQSALIELITNNGLEHHSITWIITSVHNAIIKTPVLNHTYPVRSCLLSETSQVAYI